MNSNDAVGADPSLSFNNGELQQTIYLNDSANSANFHVAGDDNQSIDLDAVEDLRQEPLKSPDEAVHIKELESLMSQAQLKLTKQVWKNPNQREVPSSLAKDYTVHSTPQQNNTTANSFTSGGKVGSFTGMSMSAFNLKPGLATGAGLNAQQ